MQIDKHDLHHEFPEYNDEIHYLKLHNNHFHKLFIEYHQINNEVVKIEEGSENTSDDYLEGLKKQRLQHKDRLFLLIKNHQASNA